MESWIRCIIKDVIADKKVSLMTIVNDIQKHEEYQMECAMHIKCMTRAILEEMVEENILKKYHGKYGNANSQGKKILI